MFRTNVSPPSFKVTRIGELGTTLAVTSNRRTLIRFLIAVNVVPSSAILVTLMMEGIRSSECRSLQEPHDVMSQKLQNLLVFVFYVGIPVSPLIERIYSSFPICFMALMIICFSDLVLLLPPELFFYPG
jgi:hypothetical protein